jgi:signal transduction histidine kinase
MKLLNKSLLSYVIYSTVILLIAVPIFYFVIQHIVAEDVDESLQMQKMEMLNKLEKVSDRKQYTFLSEFEPQFNLTPLNSYTPYDTVYTAVLFDKITDELIPHRILESNVMINGFPYTIQLKSSLIDNENLIESIVTVMAVLMLLIAVGLYIINVMISKKIWKPFYSTLERLHNYEIEKDQVLQYEKTDINEFSDLNKGLHELTRRSSIVYQSQKEFTENASHEMQTPLAIFQGKLELLMQTTPLSDEQGELIGDLANASQRLNRLNKSLLLLSKIENNQFPEKEKASLKEITGNLIEQYRFQAYQRNITFETDLATDIPVEANKTLIEVLLSNLISNAIRHNILNGIITITALDNKTLTIRNTGSAHAIESGIMFKRFHKDSTDINSLGLGLEIVKKIADLYNYKIGYSFNNNLHNFSVKF